MTASPRADFERHARSYAAAHEASIAASGESAEYFAVYKQKVIERLLGRGFDRPVLDFGCGTGRLTQLLAGSFATVHGYDPSRACLELARRDASRATFHDDAAALRAGSYGAIVLANVLHHVAPADRPSLLRSLVGLLGGAGRLIVFEHNPYNPLTRRAVALCPFDDDARLLSPRELTRGLRNAGLRAVALRFITFFPRPLRALRALEPLLGWLPLGAQVCAWGWT